VSLSTYSLRPKKSDVFLLSDIVFDCSSYSKNFSVNYKMNK
jgi:hypothetical protein